MELKRNKTKKVVREAQKFCLEVEKLYNFSSFSLSPVLLTGEQRAVTCLLKEASISRGNERNVKLCNLKQRRSGKAAAAAAPDNISTQ